MSIQDIIERIFDLISGLGFVLPIAIFALVNLFSRRNRKQPAQEQQPQRPAAPSLQPQRRLPGPTMQPMPSFPNGPVTWTQPVVPASELPAPSRTRSGWGTTFGDNDARRDEDRALRWGSAFDSKDARGARGARKDGESLKWGSAFDREAGKTQWGWDEAEWGSGFSKKKDTEPRITIG